MVIIFTVNCVCLFVFELFIERHFAGWFLAPVCRHTELPPNYMAVFGHPLYEPTTSASRCTRACIHTYIHAYIRIYIHAYVCTLVQVISCTVFHTSWRSLCMQSQLRTALKNRPSNALS